MTTMAGRRGSTRGSDVEHFELDGDQVNHIDVYFGALPDSR